MIRIENAYAETTGWRFAIWGMRNSMNSWNKSDSHYSDYVSYDNYQCNYYIGPEDLKLMKKLCAAGPDHRKFMRMIVVYVNVVAPLYWWKQYDTYKIGTVTNSCSTMHKIAENEFDRRDFSCEHLDNRGLEMLDNQIEMLNDYRKIYNKGYSGVQGNEVIDIQKHDKRFWWNLIQSLPSSYNQKRTIMVNYETLINIYNARKTHKLDEWREFCEWIEQLPYAELITGVEKNESA